MTKWCGDSEHWKCIVCTVTRAEECNQLFCPFLHLLSEFLLPATVDEEWFQTSGFKKLFSWSFQLIIHCCLLFPSPAGVLEFFRWLIISYSVHIPVVLWLTSSWNTLVSEPKRQSDNLRLWSSKEFRDRLLQSLGFTAEKTRAQRLMCPVRSLKASLCRGKIRTQVS